MAIKKVTTNEIIKNLCFNKQRTYSIVIEVAVYLDGYE